MNHEVIIVQSEDEQSDLIKLMKDVTDVSIAPRFRSSSADNNGRRKHESNSRHTARLPRIE